MKALVRFLFKPFLNVGIIIAVLAIAQFELPLWAFLVTCGLLGGGLGAAEEYLRRRRPDLFTW